MTVRCFVDSNVFVYADDRSAGAKRDRARELIREVMSARTGVLSLQVLQEYFAVSTRKLGVSAAAARRRIELLSRLDVVILGVEDVLAAIDLHRLHGFAIWDALVIRAALNAGCRILYSEDLQEGRRINGLEVVNPFKT
ncbi:MAG TPA: PIN domain-containing protein [Thermoanaerobaculia bacterium]|jgi:predicted nucleic acid-binding protein|nr:PIN domain-containing protein [Thermoanaerobaculia bacterium]